MSSTVVNSFMDFYNASPNVMILDKKNNLYSFPDNIYLNGTGGTLCTENDTKNYANGRKFENFGGTLPKFIPGEPWKSCFMIDPSNYLMIRGALSLMPEDNAYDDKGLIILNDIAKDTYLGYSLKSGGIYGKNNSHDYIVADRGSGNYTFIFAVYIKKAPIDFFNDFINNSNQKNKFLKMASNDYQLKNTQNNYIRYDTDSVINLACLNSSMPSDGIVNCDKGTALWCGNDNNINKDLCINVKNACSASGASLDDTTIPNYKCNTLVKNLNDQNKISILNNTFSNFTSLTTTQKNVLSKDFNTSMSTAVEDALCSLTKNQNDEICVNHISKTFINLIKTNDMNPVLIMYFAGDATNNLFTQPAGMDYTNTLKIIFNKINGINIPPTKTLSNIWYAKLYVYIIPSSVGDYLFKINADDDAKLYLNNTLIIDAWGKGCCKDYTASSYITLNPINGPYLLYAEFRDSGGAANITISYTVKSDKTQTYNDFLILPNTSYPVLIPSKLYMSKFNPYTITSNAKENQSMVYCLKNNRFATDEYCLGNTAKGIIGVNNTKDPMYKTAMSTYCMNNNKFATDTAFCNNPNYKSYIMKTEDKNIDLETAIKNYCIDPKNNIYPTGTNTTYCRMADNDNTTNYTVDGVNMNMHLDYAKTLRDSRLSYVKDSINKSINTSDNTKGIITQDVQDYINIDYPNIQKKFGNILYPNSNIIPSELYTYCENEPDITKNQLCNSIYTTYAKDSNIIPSQQRITDFQDGIKTNAYMGKSNTVDPAIANAQNIKYLAQRDNPNTFAKYLPYATNYCKTEDNIVSPECQLFYNNVKGVINDGINTQYNNATVNSTFSNKESFNNEEECNEEIKCDNLYILLIFLFIIIFITLLCNFSKYNNNDSNKHNIKYEF